MINVMFWLIFIQVAIFCASAAVLGASYFAQRRAELVFEPARIARNRKASPDWRNNLR